jgi:hypothetical protein
MVRFHCQLASLQVLRACRQTVTNCREHIAGQGTWSQHPKQVDAENQCQGYQSRESRIRQMVQVIPNRHCHQMVMTIPSLRCQMVRASRFLQSLPTGQELEPGHPESAERCHRSAKERVWQLQEQESACRSHLCKAR